MTTTATRLLDNYIAGAGFRRGPQRAELDVLNPATGEALARVPLSVELTSTPRSRRRGLRSRSGVRCR